MKAKVLKDFKDKYTGEYYKAGATIMVTEERFNEILSVDKLVEAVPTKKTAKKSAKKDAE